MHLFVILEQKNPSKNFNVVCLSFSKKAEVENNQFSAIFEKQRR